jgi:8-oxo-dGTP diphosphatase
VIPVACGVVVNARGEALIAQRPAGKIAAGKWEFPGGKIEPGEAPEHALARELEEELGLRVQRARPLIRLRHDYSDRTVILDAWLITAFEGAPQARELQAFEWVAPADLLRWDLLAADGPIVTALRLPEHYVFTPTQGSLERLLAGLDLLPRGALLRLRLPELDDADYLRIAERLLPECRRRGLRLMLDRAPEQVMALGADGWHATESALRRIERRPLPADRWFAASVHGAGGIALARRRGVDCAVLGPVLETATHPGTPPLGWPAFAALAREAGLPVYAIGGVGPSDLEQGFAHGAQGVAAIRAYWSSLDGSTGSSSRTGSA